MVPALEHGPHFMPNRDRPPLARVVLLTLAGAVPFAQAQDAVVADLGPLAALEEAWEATSTEDQAALVEEFRASFEQLEHTQGAPRASLWLLEHQFAPAQSSGAAPAESQQPHPEPADLRARRLRFEALSRQSRALEGPTLERFLRLVAAERWIAREHLRAMGRELADRDVRPEVAGGTLVALAANSAPPGSESSEDQHEARRYLDEVTTRWPRSAAATRARALRWRLDNLSVGATAPDFLGFDAKGNELRLAHFRGRVVVLHVWSFQERDSLPGLMQGERLRYQYWDAAFTWLGLNRDPDPEAFRRACEDRDIDWKQHLWEGGDRRPATQAWRLDGEPLLVLLDGQGVIRGVDLEPKRLEERIASLLTALREKIPSRDIRPEEPAREGD